MFYEFYIDQFVAEHLLSGYLLLLTASELMKQRKSQRRIVAGSAAGVCCMAVLICMGRSEWYLIGMLTAGLVVFAEREWRRTIKSMSMLFFSAACYGGVLECVSGAVGISGASGMMLAGLLVWYAFRWKKEQSFETGICEVRLEWEERSCIVRALIDSGNMLHEPLTGEAVSILQKKQADQLLGEDWELRRGFYLIPYHSLGTEKDWMQAVRIDRMQIRYKEKEKMAEEPVIALYQGQIGKRYQMILHQEHVGCEAPEKTPEIIGKRRS